MPAYPTYWQEYPRQPPTPESCTALVKGTREELKAARTANYLVDPTGSVMAAAQALGHKLANGHTMAAFQTRWLHEAC